MDRLTGWEGEHAYNLVCFEGGGCPDMDTSRCDSCENVFAVYDKLAEYEDSGFEPEDVAKFAKYERETRSLLKDAHDVMAYRLTGLSPDQVVTLAADVKSVCEHCGERENDCGSGYGDDGEDECLFAKWKVALQDGGEQE